MKTRRYKMWLSVIVALCLFATTAVAAAPGDTETVQPYYTGIATFDIVFNINDGVAECESSVSISSMSNTGKLIMSLQISSNGESWSNYKTWSASGSGAILLDETCNARSGYYFRVHCNANVYDANGNIVGMNVANSDPIYCE